MAEGLNKAMLLGNLGEDPTLRHTSGGTSVLTLRMATTESYLDRDKQRKEKTNWHSICVWGKRGEALSAILRKGDRIFVEGSIENSTFEGRDGTKKWKSEINARNVILCGGKRGSEAPAHEPSFAPQNDAMPEDDDDIPF